MKRQRVVWLQFVLSLVLALALWTFVSFTQNPTQERTYQVPIQVRSLQPGYVIVDPSSGQPSGVGEIVYVLASGPVDDLNRTSASDFRATVDLGSLGEGTHQVPVRVQSPTNLRIRNSFPNMITVRLEPQATKRFTIEHDLVGQPPFAALDDEIQVATDEVIVRGPHDLVERVAEVRLRIDLQGRLQGFSDSLPLEPVDENGEVVQGVSVTPNTTDVTVRLEPRLSAQRVSVVPQLVGDVPSGYVVRRYDWTPKSVEVLTPVVISSTLQTEPITLTNRTESFTQTVRLLDIGGTDAQLTSNEVTVFVDIAPFGVASNTPLFIPTITAQNVGSGLSASIETNNLTIRVSGTYQELSQLAGAQIEATVDVAGLGPGTYTLPVEINLPEGIRIVGDPPTATVTLTSNATATATAPTPANPPPTQGE